MNVWCKIWGHRWETWAFIPGQCEKKRTCKRCHQEEHQPVDHDWSDLEAVSPGSCTRRKKCRHCGLIDEDPEYDDHEWGEWIFIPGLCVSRRFCQRNNCMEERDDHEWTDWKNSRRKCPICHKTEECPNCQGAGYVILRNGPALTSYPCTYCATDVPPQDPSN
ncbi:MAG: DUF1660 family phage protein [Candidatus Omnitrophota bacterium]